jgi:hypothetical protein
VIPKTIATIVLAERPFESDDGELFEPPLACQVRGELWGLLALLVGVVPVEGVWTAVGFDVAMAE